MPKPLGKNEIFYYTGYAYKKLQDPIFFIREILGVERLTRDQIKIINSVWENKFTGVKAGHSVGKTFLASCIALTYVVTHIDSVVITTAPSMRQVRDLIWAEIHKLYYGAKYNIGGNLLQIRLEMGPKWYAEGVATEVGKEEQSAVKLQGYHAPDILIIIDEAVGVPQAIWEAIDGIANSENARILAIGNPATIHCQFYKNLLSPEWKSYTVSALNHPNVKQKRTVIPGAVSYEWVKDKIRKWCWEDKPNPKYKTFEFEGKNYRPNNLFLWKVMGEFPLDDVDRLISVEKIEQAMNREKLYNLNICDIAVDVARYGGDSSVIAVNINNNFELFTYYGLDLASLANEVIEKIKLYKPKRIGIDADGLGAGVFDIVNEWRDNTESYDFVLIELHSSAPPQDDDSIEKFYNLRARMYYQLSKDIDFIKLPYDEDLLEELSIISTKVDRMGKIIISSKEEIRKKIGRSTDKADAIAYCNWLKYDDRDVKLYFVD